MWLNRITVPSALAMVLVVVVVVAAVAAALRLPRGRTATPLLGNCREQCADEFEVRLPLVVA